MTVLSIPSRALPQVKTRRRIVVRPTIELTRMTRYRGGTYSPTVDQIVFSDGTTARTDLIRLNPNLHAYSLDFTGIAPHNPTPYRLGTWSALTHQRTHLRTPGCEPAIDWIVRNSFPMLSTAELSDQLRQAGYPLAAANISEHEAIAATQAAIWYLTNGLSLDTQPLHVPVAAQRAPGPMLTFEFDGTPQLGGYSVWVAGDAPVTLMLQKSANGVDWQDVSGSQLTTKAGSGRYEHTLGIGSTLSTSGHGRIGRGYRYYRLTPAAADGPTFTVDHVRFWLTGTRHYRNADRVVHLYNYLLSGACKADHHSEEPRLVDTNATFESNLVGPFQVRIPLKLSASEGHTLVDADGFATDGVIEPSTDFYLRSIPGTSSTKATKATTLTATTPHSGRPRVLIGMAQEESGEACGRFTPIALTTPADVAIQFDISWDGDCRAETLENAHEHR